MIQMAMAAIAMLGVSTNSSAQEDLEFSMKTDFVSQYIWRGMDCGGISVQPTVDLGYKDFSIEIFGNAGLDQYDPKEIDLTLGYKWKEFNFGLTDYWQTGKDYRGQDLYFSYDAEKDAHQFEINVGYTHELFDVQLYTMVWGNDFKYDSFEDYQAYQNGKRAFSTYLEVNVPLKWKEIDWNFCAGFTPFESANSVNTTTDASGRTRYQKNHFYADGFGCVKASARATKTLDLGKIKLPLYAELQANPYLKKAYFLVGATIIPF